MINKVEAAIKRFSLIDDGDYVIVALSGGADSVALLNTLISIKEKYHITLAAAHLNHQLRGEEAERDEKFCKFLCKNYNIPIFIQSKNIRDLAKIRKISEELCGREERYAFFGDLSLRFNAKIATAHTASDNAETLIFNLSRGASVAGVSGIPPRRGFIIRPMIEVTRSEVEAYCSENNLEYVTDSTNLSDDYSRNKIRHGVIPVMRELNPSFEQSALRFTQNASETADYLKSQAQSALNYSKIEFGYDSKALCGLHPALIKTAVSMICAESGAAVESRHIDLIINILKSGGAVALHGGARAVCTQGVFRVLNNNSLREQLSVPISGIVYFDFMGKSYKANINSKKENKFLLRTRQPGDCFTYSGRGISKPLRRAMAELKIPFELRDSVPLIAEQSTVLWCAELGFSKQGLRYTQEKTFEVHKINEV